MQPRSCDDIKLLISKYVDGEATREERETVDLHVAVCTDCACKLTEYMEFAAIFAEAPVRAPQPDLRAGVYSEIGTLKEQARNKEEERAAHRPWRKLAPPAMRGRVSGDNRRGAAAWGRAWEVVSPFAAISLAMVALVAVVMSNKPVGVAPHTPEDVAVIYPSVPTIPATIVYRTASNGGLQNDGKGVPPPMGTKLASVLPLASASVVVEATSTDGSDMMLGLQQVAPIMEAEAKAPWHQLRDAAFGYSIAYPSNWWTEVKGGTRLFFPWSEGGTKYAPYWIEARIESNPQHLNAQRASQVLFGGKGKLEPGGVWLRYSEGDDVNFSDEIYAFDTNNMLVLRLNVPRSSLLGTFSERLAVAQTAFSRMSGKVSLGGGQSRVLFLNGGDVYSVGTGNPPGEADVRAVWRGYGARWAKQFALSPDGQGVAFSTTNSADDYWATDLNLGQIEASSASGSQAPQTLMSGAEIHSIAWYSDRDLLVIARTKSLGLGIYRISMAADHTPGTPQLLTKLGDDVQGAQGLSVSPDRQLISFLAPVDVRTGTDIYAVRPDGSNLTRIISHAGASAFISPNGSAVDAGEQAVKSYIWTEGKLEPASGGYSFKMLYTLGNAESPTRYKGGSLYGAPNSKNGLALDPASLQIGDSASVQIVHVAYSPATGKVAFSGFYNDKEFRVETLAGLWTADLVSGTLTNVTPLPMPDSSHGATDLQWSPDGKSLIYRDTVPSSEASFADRYDGHSPFSILKLDISSGQKTVLYDASNR